MTLEHGQFLGQAPEAYSQHEVVLTSGSSEVRASRFGAMIMGWRDGGKEVLFPLQLIDGKLRGGIPFLWPKPGLVSKKRQFSRLPQHGFAREIFWPGRAVSGLSHEIVDQEMATHNLGKSDTLSLGLYANEKTKAIYPYDFGLGVGIELRGYALIYEVGVANRGKEEMPFVFGLHPYFQLPSLKALSGVRTNIPGFKPDLEALKESLICEPPKGEVKIEIPEQGLITMSFSAAFKKIVVWTDGRGPYLCVEPWTAGPLAIEDPEKRINLPPNGYRSFSLAMQFQPFGV